MLVFFCFCWWCGRKIYTFTARDRHTLRETRAEVVREEGAEEGNWAEEGGVAGWRKLHDVEMNE